MNAGTLTVDVEALVIEIQRYLAAVDAFRAAGCSPRWTRELTPQHPDRN
jgi:hypothetical protein